MADKNDPDKNDPDESNPDGNGIDCYSAGYTSTQVINISGFTHRQLDDWARKGRPVVPSLQEASGSGSRRMYSFQDLLEIRVVRTLVDGGFSLNKISSTFEYIRDELKGSALISHIVISGKDIYAVVEGQLESVLNRPGQTSMNVLTMGPIRQDLHDRIRVERPELEVPDIQTELEFGTDA